MQETFQTPHPVTLYVELKSRGGNLVVVATDTTDTVVEVIGAGRGVEEDLAVSVTQRGDEILVVALPIRHGLFGSSARHLDVRVTLPLDSRVVTKMGSADVRLEGRIGGATLRSGSGEVTVSELTGEAFVEAGSGDVSVRTAHGPLQVKSGSGTVSIGRLEGPATVSTGSGDVLVESVLAALSVKSGSGDLRVRETWEDLTLNTASGDLCVEAAHCGQLTAKNASGDITVGIPAGVPVWTDVSSLTGRVGSDLASTGRPADGQDYVELRARTVSGDVTLMQV